MTAPTPETLSRHELAGLPVRVVDATNPALVGIEGRVRQETRNTLVVDDGEASRVVPKAEATFEFALTDETAGSCADSSTESAPREGPGTASEPDAPNDSGFPTVDRCDGEGVAYVTVDGARLLSRPALRTEHTGDSKWESD